ncbi:transposase [Lawsonibacter asaccharolyticus]|nr:transposase [Lawsonibacter asaccharolyticus]
MDKFALTNAVYHVAAGYKNFFEGRAKHPRFKSRKDSKQSYTTNWTNGNIKVIPPERRAQSAARSSCPSWPGGCRHPPGAAEDWVIKSATVSMNNSGQFCLRALCL